MNAMRMLSFVTLSHNFSISVLVKKRGEGSGFQHGFRAGAECYQVFRSVAIAQVVIFKTKEGENIQYITREQLY